MWPFRAMSQIRLILGDKSKLQFKIANRNLSESMWKASLGL